MFVKKSEFEALKSEYEALKKEFKNLKETVVGKEEEKRGNTVSPGYYFDSWIFHYLDSATGKPSFKEKIAAIEKYLGITYKEENKEFKGYVPKPKKAGRPKKKS